MGPPPELQEQQEKLRRAVDDWRCRSHKLLKNLHANAHVSCSSSPAASQFSSSDPIRVHIEPLEYSGLSSLIQSDNVDLAKFVTVLSFDCIEISRLRRHASRNIFRQLVLFGHRSSSQEVLLEGEPQKAFGQSIHLFSELYETTRRLTSVLGNLLQQLNSIYSLQDKNGRPYQSFKNINLRSVFDCFGEGLAVFLVLDEILLRNTHIKGYLSLFARMLNKVKLEPVAFDVTVENVDHLALLVSQIEKLLNVGFFQHLFLGVSSWSDTLQKVRRNRKFLDACTSCICDGLSYILSCLDSWKEYPSDRRKLLHYVALFLFSAYTSGEAPEKKSVKVFVEMIQMVPLLYVEGGVRFTICDIMKSHCPQLLSSCSTLREAVRDCDVIKNNYLIRLTEMHSRDWQANKDALSCWAASFLSTLHPVTEVSDCEACLRFHLKQILQGLLLANRMRILAVTMLDLHALLEVPIRREKLKSLRHMVIQLKVVESTFHNKGLEIIQSLPHIINLIQADIEQFLLSAKVQLHSEVTKGGQVGKIRFLSSLASGGKDTDTRVTDSLSLVVMALQLLQGGGGHERQHVLSVTLDVLQSIGHLEVDFLRMKKALSKLAVVADFQNIVEEATNCSFLYWRKELMGDWLSVVYMDANKFMWLQYLLNAFSDGLWLLKLGHVGQLTQQSHEEDIDNAVKNEIVIPLCRDIETDIRLHVHSTHLKGSVQVNPTKTGVRNLSWYLQMKPLRLPFKFINIRLLVESYLNSTFYNHTAMSSYNWKIYSEMRQLAELKYGLVLDEIHIREHSLSHGLCITEILQNLQMFARNFSYDINKQLLMEKVSNGQGRKTLTIVGVEHVASSIATHGLTMISTVTDQALEFLCQQNSALSDLLLDTFMRSHLEMEYQFWKSNKGTVINYPFIRAEQLSVAMGKLPSADYGVNFIERLHSVITETGNVLGLLRVLRAGGSRHANNASRFLSISRSITSFMETCRKLGFTDRVVEAGRAMDIAIKNNYQPMYRTNSFSFPIEAILKNFQSTEYRHFRDFFLIIPALTVYLIDSKAQFKDKSLRRDHESGTQIAADDGFIMGVAYILKITGQEKLFDGLHWFMSANKHLEQAVLSLQSSQGLEQHKGNTLARLKLWSQAAPSAISTESQKAIHKLRRFQNELELLECGLNVARTIMS